MGFVNEDVPRVVNDPVTPKLPVIKAEPVNGKGGVAGANEALNACVAYDEVPNNEPVILPVTISEPDILTAFVLSTENIPILPLDTENRFVDEASDMLKISPPLPEMENIVDPLLFNWSTIPEDADIFALPVTCNELKLPESV